MTADTRLSVRLYVYVFFLWINAVVSFWMNTIFYDRRLGFCVSVINTLIIWFTNTIIIIIKNMKKKIETKSEGREDV